MFIAFAKIKALKILFEIRSIAVVALLMSLINVGGLWMLVFAESKSFLVLFLA